MSNIKKIILGTVCVLILIVIIIAKQMLISEQNSEQKYKQIVSEVKIDNVDLSKIPDGEYTGSYDAVLIGAKVTVTVKDKQITDIILVNQTGKSAKAIPGKVVKAQSLKVDAVSGATASSTVILKSIENALILGKS
jgi:uncharacterized protein with FMN-binding domain